MFNPVSRIPYLRCTEDAQILVCVCNPEQPLESLLPTWKDRAAALFRCDQMVDVFRDVLANPQIRAIVLIQDSGAFRDVWNAPQEGIPEEHLSVVRRFVDLYDEDCGIHDALPPFWPKRLIYEDPGKDSKGAHWKSST